MHWSFLFSKINICVFFVWINLWFHGCSQHWQSSSISDLFLSPVHFFSLVFASPFILFFLLLLPTRKWVRSLRLSVCRWRSSATAFSSSSTTWKRSSRPSSTWPIRRYDVTLNPHWSSSDMMMMMMMMMWLTLCWSLQVSHLQELVREGEQNLSSAQTQISCLRETQEKLKIELDATRSRVRETSNLLTDLQVRIKLKFWEQQHHFLIIGTIGMFWTQGNIHVHLFMIGNFFLYFCWLVCCLQATFTVCIQSPHIWVLYST